MAFRPAAAVSTRRSAAAFRGTAAAGVGISFGATAIMWSRIRLLRLLPLLVAVLAVVLGGAGGPARAQEQAPDAYPLRPPDTASPRDTLASFQQDVRTAIRRFTAREAPAAVHRATVRVLRCLDLSGLPPANLVDQGWERALQLLEILERIELPPLEQIPDRAAVAATGLTRWTIPNTEITIARTADGPSTGEFQFTAQTVARLPAFYEQALLLPYKPGALAGAYAGWLHAPGPWLPLAWTVHLPRLAYAVVLGQTIWQWLGTLAALGLTAAVAIFAYRLGRRVDQPAAESAPRRHVGRLTAMIVAVLRSLWSPASSTTASISAGGVCSCSTSRSTACR